jgi:hypothetical protein
MNVDEEGLLDLAGEIADGAWVDWASLGGGSPRPRVDVPAGRRADARGCKTAYCVRLFLTGS